MRALVIGAGAVGAFIGAALEDCGFLPSYMGRQGPTGLTARVAYTNGSERLLCCRPEPQAWQAADLALVAVKAFDLEAALAWTASLAPGTPVIPLANGAVETIVRAAAKRWPHLVWRLGFSTFGISALDEPGCYAVRSKGGEVALGPLIGGAEPSPAERLLLERPGVFQWHSDILALARRKWLFNTVINTLCAARQLKRNGDLLHDIPMLAAVFNEAWLLGAQMFGPWPSEKSAAFAAMEALIEATAENENSMARDRRLGRRTETAFLAGLARDARQFPLLVKLAELLI